VEQAHYVDCGKNEFESEHLKFEYFVEDVIKEEKINCLLVSGSIQYFENPKEWFEKLQHYNFQFILFDRTSFIEGETRITIQTVPETIYPATLPCWFFNEAEFINSFNGKYELIEDFDSKDETTRSTDNKKMYWKGFFFKLK
jgi:putative methyltransferase (TIGR04325 family)